MHQKSFWTAVLKVFITIILINFSLLFLQKQLNYRFGKLSESAFQNNLEYTFNSKADGGIFFSEAEISSEYEGKEIVLIEEFDGVFLPNFQYLKVFARSGEEIYSHPDSITMVMYSKPWVSMGNKLWIYEMGNGWSEIYEVNGRLINSWTISSATVWLLRWFFPLAGNVYQTYLISLFVLFIAIVFVCRGFFDTKCFTSPGNNP